MRTDGTLAGGLMVCGTSSDAGKTTVVTGICRVLSRRGLRAAPFKAQNMALNSMVTADGAEIGRAQVAQAEAAGVEPQASMNPILLKPTSDRMSQVIVMGRPWKTLDAGEYQRSKPQLWSIVTSELANLRRKFDVVVCEGAGSPAEINLLDNDLVNLRLAHHARLPALLVGDIDRGGVFASMYGTVSLLTPELRECVRGFVINKFRGDREVLRPGPEELERRTGIPTIGVLPWMDGLDIDAEDSLSLRNYRRVLPSQKAGGLIDVAVVAFPRISNFTDVDALALEADVNVRLVDNPDSLGFPDVLILPGTKSTVADLDWLRETGLARAIVSLADENTPLPLILGICGGYQVLGGKIDDRVESPVPRSTFGLGLLPVSTVFEPQKITARQVGIAFGQPVAGYEIRHGRTVGGSPWITFDETEPSRPGESSSAHTGKVLGTSLHGLLESDPFRQAFLAEVARRAGRTRSASRVSFAGAREDRYDRLADAVEEHLDFAAIERLVKESATQSPAGDQA